MRHISFIDGYSEGTIEDRLRRSCRNRIFGNFTC